MTKSHDEEQPAMTSLSRRKVLATGAAGAVVAALPATAMAAVRRMELLDDFDAIGLARLVTTRQVSAAELLDLAVARVEETNPRFNFMAHKFYDRAKQAIAAGLPDGPFRGVPWLLKDLNTNLEGTPAGEGSRYYAGNISQFTSELVRRHQQAGLVIFGKTTSPEFGLTATTESAATGITRNPWDPERIAGGSSGGSGAAVAAGVLPMAHATDGGGSIRIPASCCGLFGMKPSRGRVPMGPGLTEGWGGLSVHHAVTRSVRDSALLLDMTHGIEPGSRYSAPTPDGTFLSYLRKHPGQLRVALALSPPAGTPVDPECVAAARDAARLLQSLGHKVEEAAPKVDVAALGAANFALLSTAMVARIDARAKETGIAPSPDVLEPVPLMFYNIGKQTDGAAVARAHETFQRAAYAVGVFMEDYDIIVSPTLATPPPPVGRLGLSPADFTAWGEEVSAFTPFTGLFNVTGQPSMSLPLALSAKGLPIGVQMTGRYGAEATLFSLAAQVEQAQPWWKSMTAPVRRQS
ncbi:amidase family protein [Croceicoccus sp. F390]|uniref:Amidase family protein n=1 Tax=Croceicoccus esteveae TaxID=3075597 RepID=A0ABU2ZHF4_9SPHN|nr:amidase family protein [Croceicoccus sp. F390]MDT0576020.1 amidase family protein [Croceicoccus sp. F390]